MPSVARPAATALLDREAELTLLAQVLERACTGRGGVVAIDGEPGIGKTALLRAASEAARSLGMIACEARASRLERDFAFGVVRQLLDPVLRAARPSDRDELLAGPARQAVGALEGWALEPADRLGLSVSYGALHGLHSLAANLAARAPLLVAVDDLPHADPPSLRFLAYLARRLEDLPVALVVTARSGEEVADPSLAAELRGALFGHIVRLARLGRVAVTRLVGDALGDGHADPAFGAACHTATGGNPFLLGELVRTLAAGQVAPTEAEAARVPTFGPAAVARAVLDRVVQVAPAGVTVARAVAVLGSARDHRLLAKLTKLDEQVVSDTVAGLVRGGVLCSESLGFTHPIVGEAVHQELLPGTRSAVHTTAARLLDEAGAPAEQVAGHLLDTEPAGDPWVVEVLRAGARAAFGRGTPDLAVGLLRRALRELSMRRPELLAELGAAELALDPGAAASHLEQALAGTSDPRRRARVSLELSRALTAAARAPEAVAALERAIEDLGDHDQELARTLEVRLLFTAVQDLRTAPGVAGRIERIHRQVDAGEVDHGPLVAVAALHETFQNGSRERALALARRALDGTLASGEEEAIVAAYALRVLVLVEEPALAERYANRTLVQARRQGAMLLETLVLALRSRARYGRGWLAGARADAQAALDLIGAVPNRPAVALPAAFLVDAMVEDGDLEAAADLLDECGLGGSLPHVWAYNRVLSSRAGLKLARGDAGGALADFLECGRRMEAWGIRNPTLMEWRTGAARAHLALGRPRPAERLARQGLALARAWGAPRAIGGALHAIALARQGDERLALLARAVAVLERSPGRIELAWGLIELGTARRAAGELDAARELLRRALDLAQRQGATAAAARAHAELLATGARPRRLHQSGPGALTESEHRVATLAAQGRTNKEIAESLVVAQRTVEIHLTHTYRKLGIAGRSQLRGRLVDSGGSSEHSSPPKAPPSGPAAGHSG